MSNIINIREAIKKKEKKLTWAEAFDIKHEKVKAVDEAQTALNKAQAEMWEAENQLKRVCNHGPAQCCGICQHRNGKLKGAPYYGSRRGWTGNETEDKK